MSEKRAVFFQVKRSECAYLNMLLINYVFMFCDGRWGGKISLFAYADLKQKEI